MKKTALRFLSVLALATGLMLTLTGCASGPYEPKSDRNAPESDRDRVVLLDDSLNDKLRVDQIRTLHRANNLLVVEVHVRNRTGHDITLQAQTLYRDAVGHPLNYSAGNGEAWTTLILTANSMTIYRSQALTPSARRFIVRIRTMERPTS